MVRECYTEALTFLIEFCNSSTAFHLQPGGFIVLDYGGASEESSAGDDIAADIGIDMRKLLSSSSQAGSGGPNLSRQLMTHLRLLQAVLKFLMLNVVSR